MEKQYYLDYFNYERSHWWFRVRNAMIMDHIRSVAGSKESILNVGAGTGYSSELLSQFGKVTSLEYDADCCAFVKEKTGQDFITGSAENLPFADNSFDVVCAFDVIEHVPDEKAAAREILRVCKPGGLVFLTVPAFMFLWSEHDDINHHIRRYRRKGFLSLFGNRIKVNYITYFNFFLFFPIAAYRLISNVLPRPKRELKSDFEAVKIPGVDRILSLIFSLERPLLGWQVRLPVGVSILLSGINDKNPGVPNR